MGHNVHILCEISKISLTFLQNPTSEISSMTAILSNEIVSPILG